ncbi:MAG TPA: lysoplasmalogenase [Lysobacter sp.]
MPVLPKRRVWLAAIAAFAVLAIVGSYSMQFHWLHYVFKPLATLSIAAMAFASHTEKRRYRLAVFAGLLLSALGDVFLMLPGDQFVFGLGSFLFAHIAYLVAYTARERLLAALWPYVVFAAVSAGVLALLWAHVPQVLRIPVVVYVAVLGSMAAQAGAVWWRRRDTPTACAAIGAAFFVTSDAVLAIDHFATPFALAPAVILSTYWVAQTLIALSVGHAPEALIRSS